MKYKILICDDEKEILEILELYLKKNGYEIIKAFDGLQVLEIINKNNDIDLVILDVMMPYINGYKLIKKIRSLYNIPILMLSAKSKDEDKILGLNLGADDYITKPFNPLEIVARVNAQIRRVHKLSCNEEKRETIKIGEVELDTFNVKALVGGSEIDLTSIEYKILKYLMENEGRILTKNQIFRSVWKEEFFTADNTIMVHISRLREKIEKDSRNPVYLKTGRGLGYKFENKIKE